MKLENEHHHEEHHDHHHHHEHRNLNDINQIIENSSDSIVDIVGTSILINKINPDKIISSIVNDGYGFIECAHGTMSVPVKYNIKKLLSSKIKF